MTTWDDKPNDYEHALKIIELLQAEIERLQQLLEREGELAYEAGCKESYEAGCKESYEAGCKQGYEAAMKEISG